MTTAIVPSGVRLGSRMVIGGVVLGGLGLSLGLSLLIAKDGARLHNAFDTQSTVVRSAAAPSASLSARLSPPWRKTPAAYPLDWRSGRHSPFSYDTPYGDVVRERAQIVAVAPAWTIVYEGRRPARRHKR